MVMRALQGSMKRPVGIRHFVASFSERTEFWLVLLVAFGWPIWNSVRSSLNHLFSPGPLFHVITDRSRLWTCAIQLAILGFVLWIGKLRGWSIRQLGLHPSWRLTGMGVLLFCATFIILIPFVIAIHVLAPTFYRIHGVARGLSFAGILATAVVNPLYEETLACGYLIERLRQKGAGVAITCGALVRYLYHPLQSTSSIGVLVAGFIFGYVFWRYRQLWPVIVAHALMDFLALVPLVWKR